MKKFDLNFHFSWPDGSQMDPKMVGKRPQEKTFSLFYSSNRQWYLIIENIVLNFLISGADTGSKGWKKDFLKCPNFFYEYMGSSCQKRDSVTNIFCFSRSNRKKNVWNFLLTRRTSLDWNMNLFWSYFIIIKPVHSLQYWSIETIITDLFVFLILIAHFFIIHIHGMFSYLINIIFFKLNAHFLPLLRHICKSRIFAISNIRNEICDRNQFSQRINIILTNLCMLYFKLHGWNHYFHRDYFMKIYYNIRQNICNFLVTKISFKWGTTYLCTFS